MNTFIKNFFSSKDKIAFEENLKTLENQVKDSESFLNKFNSNLLNPTNKNNEVTYNAHLNPKENKELSKALDYLKYHIKMIKKNFLGKPDELSIQGDSKTPQRLQYSAHQNAVVGVAYDQLIKKQDNVKSHINNEIEIHKKFKETEEKFNRLNKVINSEGFKKNLTPDQLQEHDKKLNNTVIPFKKDIQKYNSANNYEERQQALGQCLKKLDHIKREFQKVRFIPPRTSSLAQNQDHQHNHSLPSKKRNRSIGK